MNRPKSAKPNAATLWRWLSRAVTMGLILIEGTGRKADPLRYWLPNAEERWRAEQPFYDTFGKQRQQLKLPFESLRARKRIDVHNRQFDLDLDRPLKRGEELWPPGSPVE